jgi:hypothetical protein
MPLLFVQEPASAAMSLFFVQEPVYAVMSSFFVQGPASAVMLSISREFARSIAAEAGSCHPGPCRPVPRCYA